MSPMLDNVQREYCVVGMRRSGQHAIVRWIMRQLPGHSLFLNDLDPGEAPGSFRQPEQRLLDRYYVEGAECPIPTHSRVDNLVYNHEDSPFAAAPPHVLPADSRHFQRILVLRDPFNLFASRYFFWVRMDPAAPRWRWDDTPLWANHANRHLELERQPPAGVTLILLERWQSDAEYRRRVARQLGLNFTDAGHKDVDHIGSTFDLHRFS